MPRLELKDIIIWIRNLFYGYRKSSDLYFHVSSYFYYDYFYYLNRIDKNIYSYINNKYENKMMKTKILKYANYFLMIVGAILMSYSIPLSGDGRDWLLYLGSVMFNCGWIYLVLSDVKRRLKS